MPGLETGLEWECNPTLLVDREGLRELGVLVFLNNPSRSPIQRCPKDIGECTAILPVHLDYTDDYDCSCTMCMDLLSTNLVCISVELVGSKVLGIDRNALTDMPIRLWVARESTKATKANSIAVKLCTQ